MSSEQVGILVSMAIAIVGWVSTYVQNRERFARLEVKVDTMWDFQLRRAESEAVKLGIGRRNSPLKINEDTKKWFEPLEKKLKSFYQSQGCKLNNRDLAIAIEKNFGDEIASVVCIPKGLTDGSCLLIAIAVAKNKD